MIEKSGNRPKRLESLVKTGGVTAVTGVTGGLDESLTRACVRARARAHRLTYSVGNSGNTGNSSESALAGQRETAVTTFSGVASATGNTGNSGCAAPAELSAALRLPVAHLHALHARLTYRLSHALAPVAWTTHPATYEALRGSCAAFSPVEFMGAVAAGESGVATARHMAAWVAAKVEVPTWRLSREEALCWSPWERQSGFGWWPGSAWCDGHEVTPQRGWSVGFAFAAFGLTPVSVDVHPADAGDGATDAAA